jgi:hypothetical protein
MMPNIAGALTLGLGVLVFLGAPPPAGSQEAPLDRTVLPIPEPKPPVYTELDARDATPATAFRHQGAGGGA